MVKNDIDKAEELQEGHGGWNQDMEEVCITSKVCCIV